MTSTREKECVMSEISRVYRYSALTGALVVCAATAVAVIATALGA